MSSLDRPKLPSAYRQGNSSEDSSSVKSRYAHERAEWIRQQDFPNSLVGDLFHQASVSYAVPAVVWAQLAVKELASWLAQEKSTSISEELRPAVATLIYKTAGVWRDKEGEIHYIRSLSVMELDFAQLGVPSPIPGITTKNEYRYFAILAGAQVVLRFFFKQLDSSFWWVENQVQNTTSLEEVQESLTIH